MPELHLGAEGQEQEGELAELGHRAAQVRVEASRVVPQGEVPVQVRPAQALVAHQPLHQQLGLALGGHARDPQDQQGEGLDRHADGEALRRAAEQGDVVAAVLGSDLLELAALRVGRSQVVVAVRGQVHPQRGHGHHRPRLVVVQQLELQAGVEETIGERLAENHIV